MESLSSAAELTGINREIAVFPLRREIRWHLEGVAFSEGISAFMRKEKKSLRYR